MTAVPLTLSPKVVKAVRVLNAQINGYLGGKTKNRKRAAASRGNLKMARKTREKAA